MKWLWSWVNWERIQAIENNVVVHLHEFLLLGGMQDLSQEFIYISVLIISWFLILFSYHSTFNVCFFHYILNAQQIILLFSSLCLCFSLSSLLLLYENNSVLLFYENSAEFSGFFLLFLSLFLFLLIPECKQMFVCKSMSTNSSFLNNKAVSFNSYILLFLIHCLIISFFFINPI